MFELLRKNIEKKVQLSDEEFEIVKSFFTFKKLRRKQYALQEGNEAKFLFFVNKGCLRSYSIDEKGVEHILQFAIEDWWISDPQSTENNGIAVVNIDAIEDSELLLIQINQMEELSELLPKFDKFIRLLQQKRFVANTQRTQASMSFTAEQKYSDFVSRYPQIVQRVPLHMIASYLGLTAETLSRVRKQLLAQK